MGQKLGKSKNKSNKKGDDEAVATRVLSNDAKVDEEEEEEKKMGGVSMTQSEEAFVKRLSQGLGKDKPIKCWVDSDCTAFDSKCHSMSGHPCDVDDAWALLAVLNSPRCDLIGVSASYGNDAEEYTHADLKRLLGYHPKGSTVKLVHGAKKPLRPLDGVYRYKHPQSFVTVTNPAVEALYSTLTELKEQGEKLCIYCDGPATNVATLLLLHPDVKDSIDMIVMFMGRNTVDNPSLQVGTTQEDLKLYFTDFNHDLDPFAAQAVIMSGARVILVGCEIAMKSMWLWEKDLIDLYDHSSKYKNNAKNKLLNALSAQEYYIHWLSTWRIFGNHLEPWSKDHGAINGFVPFGVMSASVFFASEYLQCFPVDPSFAIAKAFKRAEGLTNFKPPAHDACDEKKEDKHHKIKDLKLSDDAKKSILLHWKQAPTALHHVHQHHEAKKRGEIIKRQSTYISRDDEKDDDDDTFFEKVGAWFDDLGKKIEKEAEKLKDDVFKKLEDLELDVYKDQGEPTYYEYFLCTNEEPHGQSKDRVAFINKHTIHSHNIYYVPAIVGEYPWHDYKEFMMNLWKGDEITAQN